MTDDTTVHAELAAYLLGALTPGERVRFERHLDSCPTCRSELLELQGTARLLSLAAPAYVLPDELEQQVFAAIERDAEESSLVFRRRRRLLPRIGAVAAVAAVAVFAFVAGLRLDGADGTVELRTALVAPHGGAEAKVEVRKTGIGRVIRFQSDELPILPKGEYYELWFVGPGDTLARPNRISAGTFHPDEDGRSHVRFAAAVDPAKYPVLSVTAEPGDGDPRRTGPEVLRSRPSS